MHTEVVIHLMNAYVWCWSKICGSLDEILSYNGKLCIKRQTQRCNKILKVKVTTTRSKVKLRSHHDNIHLWPLTNVPTKYQLPTPYGFRDIAQTRFYRSRSLRQGQRSNHGQIMTLHNYTP